MRKIFKIKSLLFVLLILTSICSCNKKDEGKDNQHVLAIYHLEGTCLDDVVVFRDECDIVIKESDKYGLLVNFGSISTDFKAFLRGDSLFIPLQSWKEYNGNQASFQGNGKMKNDSLFLHYMTGGTFGFFDCESEGEKITE